jgi:hypothetical protein
MARWLRHRLTLDAKANGEIALAASNEFAAAAAEHFGLPRPAPEPPAEDEAESSIPRPPGPDRGDQKVVTLSASVNLLMRSWMGFMMYFLIDGIAHLGLSPLVGLVPAGALALTAVIEERKQYLARERSRAAMILHKYVDVAAVKASNNCASTTAATSTGATPSWAGNGARWSSAPRSGRPGPRSSRRSTQACITTTRCAIASAPWWPRICSRPPNPPSKDPARAAEPGAFRVGFSPARVGG